MSLRQVLFVVCTWLYVATADRLRHVTAFGPANPSHVGPVAPDFTQYLTQATGDDAMNVATRFAESLVSVASAEFGMVLKNHHQSAVSGITHAYFKQTFQSAEIINADLSVHVDKFGRVISYSDAFYNGPVPDVDSVADQLVMKRILSPSQITIELARYLNVQEPDMTELYESLVSDDASTVLPGNTEEEPVYVVGNVPFTNNQQIAMTRRFIIVGDDNGKQLLPVWDVVADMKGGDDWFNVQMRLRDGQVVQLVNWVSEAQYTVYPIGVNDPSDGGRQLVAEPQDEQASPLGWHDQGEAGRGRGDRSDGKFSSTIGNNVYAQTNPNGRSDYEYNYRPTGSLVHGKTLSFDFPLDLKTEPEKYVDAAVTNLFYWNNIMHDLFYVYGFDEVSGNFQEDNFQRGGLGGDAVIANAQDGSGYNNANFATPPDGRKGRMRMYTWTTTRPKHDGDLEAGIIIHEYAHGISTRLTGGPANSNCLGWGEAGSMGEGWGDVFATMLRMRKQYTNATEFFMGHYSAGFGIRPYRYSTSMKTNPQTYAYIRQPPYGGVHAKGSVWASILYEVYWAIVDKYGFEPNWYLVKKGSQAGNIKVLRLIVEGLKLQPCRPTFVSARDAILKADEAIYEGEHACLLWKAFAKRGLGLRAKEGGFDDFDVPAECQ